MVFQKGFAFRVNLDLGSLFYILWVELEHCQCHQKILHVLKIHVQTRFPWFLQYVEVFEPCIQHMSDTLELICAQHPVR